MMLMKMVRTMMTKAMMFDDDGESDDSPVMLVYTLLLCLVRRKALWRNTRIISYVARNACGASEGAMRVLKQLEQSISRG